MLWSRWVELRVELRGLEPLTPTLPVWCATSCATAPQAPVNAPGHPRNSTQGHAARHTRPGQFAVGSAGKIATALGTSKYYAAYDGLGNVARERTNPGKSVPVKELA